MNSQPVTTPSETSAASWTEADDKLASQQGWSLFDAEGQLQLQRVDEQAAFASDAAAAEYVKAQALKGDNVAIRAILHLANHQSPDVEKFGLDQISKIDLYRYATRQLNATSAKYGQCEVCKEPVSDVFHQLEQRRYLVVKPARVRAGWTGHECNNLFGHEHCLVSRRKPNHKVVPLLHMACGPHYVND